MRDYDTLVIRKYLKLKGFVQGVGFRYRAQYAAQAVGVTGWVRNDPDGAVSMEIQGTDEQIDKVIIMIEQGYYIQITDMQVKRLPLVEDECDFRIRSY